MSQAYREKGFTLIELLIVLTILAILMTMALPNMMASRKAAHEVDAINVIREIAVAQELFINRKYGGSIRYGTVEELGNTPIGGHKLVHWPDLNEPGVRREYRFEDVEAPTSTTWCVRAVPMVFGKSGDFYYASMEDGAIRKGGEQPNSRAEVLEMDQNL